MSTDRPSGLARSFSAASLLWAAGISGLLLYACWIDFVSLRYPVHDFTIYTNFLWNSAHGRPFRFMVDQSYLRTHLSFTLLLIAPVFRLWDHPFALIALQWTFPLIGGAVVFATATRIGLGLPLRSAFTALFIAYPYAQSPVLHDFHGVSLYFVLVPWLYYCLRFSWNWLWLPWLLILGLREDAALLILPMLLYVGRNDRQPYRWLPSLLAVLYAALAMLALFPVLADLPLAVRRQQEFSLQSILASFRPVGLARRAWALFWLMLPALPLMRRRWRPVWIFPSAGLAILMMSWWSKQHGLGVHYAAYVFPLFVAGLLEAVAGEEQYRAPSGAAPFRLAAWIVCTLIAAHFTVGRYPTVQRESNRRLRLTPDPAARSALDAARAVPPTGLLVADNAVAALVANRADIAPLRDKYSLPPEDADAVFIVRRSKGGEDLFRRLTSGDAFTVRFADDGFAVLLRDTAASQGDAGRQRQ